MNGRATEIQIAPGEVVLSIVDDDTRIAVRLAADAAQLLAAEIASAAVQARRVLNLGGAPPPEQVR